MKEQAFLMYCSNFVTTLFQFFPIFFHRVVLNIFLSLNTLPVFFIFYFYLKMEGQVFIAFKLLRTFSEALE